MFKKFFIHSRDSQTYDFFYPNNLRPTTVVEKPFLFPCSDFEKYEHGIYVVVLTEISGNKNFITTRFIKDCNFSIAFESDHPWFEIVYSIIYNVVTYKLYLPKNWTNLEKYLCDLLLLPHPEPGVVFYIPPADFSASADKIVVPMKSRQKPFPVFLMSLHKQLQFHDWIVIFESLLLERWIVFHSRHLNRLTNCIFAALELLFPLEWVHLIFPCLSESSINCLGCPSPFIAGVHSCLMDKVLPLLSAGSLIVNIDEGTLHFVTSCDTNGDCNDADSDENGIPKCLVDLLVRHLHSGHLQEHLNELRARHTRRRGTTGIITERDLQDESEERATCKLVVVGFLNTMAVLLGKYRSCSQWDEAANRISIDKAAMAQSRGDILQPFLTRILESQMVHQFLDDLVNKELPKKREAAVTFAVDDIDDFDEACRAMCRWQPDHYAEVIANMASRSRRKINDIAVKVRDIARRTEQMVHENGDHISSSPSTVRKPHHLTTSSSASPTLSIPLRETNPPTESDVSRNNWITFDDNFNGEKDFSGAWEGDVVPEETLDIMQFLNSNDVDLLSEKHHSEEAGFPVVMRDFDPLYQN